MQRKLNAAVTFLSHVNASFASVTMNVYEEIQCQTVTVGSLNVTVEATRLICSVFEAVQQSNWPVGRMSNDSDRVPEPILQSLLTYCYAVGVLSSEEIESEVRDNPAIRYLCANYVPTAASIRNFRRQNVHFLKAALGRLFTLLKYNSTETYSTYSLKRLEKAAQSDSFRILAEERVQQAIAADSHALDF